MSSERRRRPRAGFDGWAELLFVGKRRLATAHDLSCGGIGVSLAGAPPPPQTPLTCEFALPGISLPLALEGRIAWREGERLGICFDDVDPGLAELLESHVAGGL